MREEILYCDICKCRTEELVAASIPVTIGSGENKQMAVFRQEICEKCAQKFSNLYHDIRREEHGTNG